MGLDICVCLWTLNVRYFHKICYVYQYSKTCLPQQNMLLLRIKVYSKMICKSKVHFCILNKNMFKLYVYFYLKYQPYYWLHVLKISIPFCTWVFCYHDMHTHTYICIHKILIEQMEIFLRSNILWQFSFLFNQKQNVNMCLYYKS